MGVYAELIREMADQGATVEAIATAVEALERRGSGSPKATRLPIDWALPPEWLQWALAEFPGMPERFATAEAAKFKDFWLGKSGKDGTKNDWQATWRNWVRKAVENHRNRTGVGKPQSAVEQRRQALAERVTNDHGIGSNRGRSAETVRQLPLLGH